MSFRRSSRMKKTQQKQNAFIKDQHRAGTSSPEGHSTSTMIMRLRLSGTPHIIIKHLLLDCKWYNSSVPENLWKTNTFWEPLFVCTLKPRAFETPVCKGFSSTICTFAEQKHTVIHFSCFLLFPKDVCFCALVPSP